MYEWRDHQRASVDGPIKEKHSGLHGGGRSPWARLKSCADTNPNVMAKVVPLLKLQNPHLRESVRRGAPGIILNVSFSEAGRLPQPKAWDCEGGIVLAMFCILISTIDRDETFSSVASIAGNWQLILAQERLRGVRLGQGRVRAGHWDTVRFSGAELAPAFYNFQGIDVSR